MKIGSFDIPEVRLYPTLVLDVKKIYEAILSGSIGSNDLAKLLGYVANTSGTFYRKLYALQTYGLMDGRAEYKVSELGKAIATPESEEHKKQSLTKAILNVALWNEIYTKYGKDFDSKNFWVKLKTITGAEGPQVQKIENVVRKWYMEDIAMVSEDSGNNSKSLRSMEPQSKEMSQQMEIPKLNNSDNVEVLSFDKYQIALPKGDLKKEWEKLKKYMDIKLEDYKYEEPKEKEATLKDLVIETQDAIEENNSQDD